MKRALLVPSIRSIASRASIALSMLGSVLGPILGFALGSVVAFAPPVAATVMVSGPDPSAAAVFFGLAIPPVGGALDERGFSGFEFLMSGVDPATNAFNANDMFVIAGNDTNPTQAVGLNVGNRNEIHDIPFNFSIEHNLVGGRNLTFSLTNTLTQQSSVLCWGTNCTAGSVARETINGEGPFDAFNGIQIQVRAQDVVGSSTSVQITALSGIDDIVGDPFFNGTVDPTLPGTIQTSFGNDAGRRGQWLIASELEFLAKEWNLQGIVTLRRPDGALTDRSKVRLAIDLVRDPNLPYVIPEPSTAVFLGLGLIGLTTLTRRTA